MYGYIFMSFDRRGAPPRLVYRPTVFWCPQGRWLPSPSGVRATRLTYFQFSSWHLINFEIFCGHMLMVSTQHTNQFKQPEGHRCLQGAPSPNAVTPVFVGCLSFVAGAEV